MRFYEINSITPQQSRIVALKRNLDSARQALKRERDNQKRQRANQQLQKLSAQKNTL